MTRHLWHQRRGQGRQCAEESDRREHEDSSETNTSSPPGAGEAADAALDTPRNQHEAVVLHPPRPWGRLSGTQEGSWEFTKHWKLSGEDEEVGREAP